MKLVVVESPAKCKKIGSYLGQDFRLIATVGHFRDLPANELAVDLATMAPTYEIDPKKADVVKRLQAEAGKAEAVLLATDPDREGEAISWHVAQVLSLGDRARRIVFHEITRKALAAAVEKPRAIDQHLVDAQQARRVLDRLVGYKVSPLLKVLKRGLSAGRVQTATLHLVAERERQRRSFKSEPYWVIRVTYREGLWAELSDEKGKPVHPKTAEEAAAAGAAAKDSPHTVRSVERTESFKKPPAPFTTSTLQQTASARLGFDPQRTMKLAQELFEAGHISYHRTDSVALSADAVALARLWIGKHFPESLPEQPPVFRSKETAQEAHEAIRPTSLAHPEGLNEHQRKLFELIRSRFLASQMRPAKIARTLVLLTPPASAPWFAARGVEILEPHWLKLEAEAEPEGEKDAKEESQKLPPLEQGRALNVEKVKEQKKDTKPPARFTEAGLVKEMERLGIGRPSTYAATIAVLHKREYIERVKKAVAPTALGMKVDDMMLAGLAALTSHEYTAKMEEDLDKIAAGTLRWQEYLKEWWGKDFEPKLKEAAWRFREVASGTDAGGPGGDPAAPACPGCGAPMRLRKGAHGEFWGCSRYPECQRTRPFTARGVDPDRSP